MRTIKVTRKKINYKEFVKRTALESDASQLIEGDAVIVDAQTNEVILIYKVLPKTIEHEEVRKHLSEIAYISSQRLSGLKNTGKTKIFGYTPRSPMKPTDSACRVAALARENPRAHEAICRYARYINDVYKDNNEPRYQSHLEMTKKVNDDYVIPGTLFTSGIININNPLKYHFDAGNFKNVNSAMIAFKDGIIGGHLVLPEYDIKLKIEDRSISLFDGQEALHGVTPIKKLREDSKRYTIVFYSLVGMWKCLPLDEEIAHARNMRWQSELKKFERKANQV